MRGLVLLIAVAFSGCNLETTRGEYVKKAELINVLQQTDRNLTVKFEEIDKAIKRLEFKQRQQERGKNE